MGQACNWSWMERPALFREIIGDLCEPSSSRASGQIRVKDATGLEQVLQLAMAMIKLASASLHITCGGARELMRLKVPRPHPLSTI